MAVGRSVCQLFTGLSKTTAFVPHPVTCNFSSHSREKIRLRQNLQTFTTFLFSRHTSGKDLLCTGNFSQNNPSCLYFTLKKSVSDFRYRQHCVSEASLNSRHVCISPRTHWFDQNCSSRHKSGYNTPRCSYSMQTTRRSNFLTVQKNVGPLGCWLSSVSPTKFILESSPKSVQPYLQLIRFDKPIGTWLLYWPCTWSIALASSPGCLPDVKLLALFGAGAFFMRGAGCIINDMWDKDYDAKVERTKLRPLASGQLTRFQALVFLGSQLSCALAILLQLNWYSVFLGASSMGLVILYPLAKRFTYWPQVVLGLTFNYGALLGWSAVHGSVDWWVCVPLYVSCLLWTLVYDTIYAHQDKYDDLLIGVKSTALKLGDNTKPWLYGFTALMSGGLTTAGLMCDMTWPFYTAVTLTCGRLAHQTYTVDLDNADSCAKVFRHNFVLGAVMFTGIVLANLLKSETSADDVRLKSAS